MKRHRTSFWGRAGSLCFLFTLILLGYQSTLSDTTALKSVNQDKNTRLPEKRGVLPSENKPMSANNNLAPLDEQPGYETGKPKEETNFGGSELFHVSSLKPIYSVEKGKVAITIDDGPTRNTMELLKVLRENKVKATFFFLGQNAAAYPQAVTQAVDDGNEVGYHSNSHPKMTAMTFEQQNLEFDLGLKKLQHLDTKPIRLFRPPYGAYNNDTKLVTEEHKMSMVLWDEDPRDWSTTKPDEVVKHVLAQVQSGGIVVLHDRLSTIEALPGIIKGIRNKGLQLITIPA